MKKMTMCGLVLALMLGFSGVALAVEGVEAPHFPMDFGTNFTGDAGSTFVSVGGNVLAISIDHEGSTDTYLVDVQAATATGPDGVVAAKGEGSFSETMGEVLSILESAKEANPADSDKLDSAIGYLQSWS